MRMIAQGPRNFQDGSILSCSFEARDAAPYVAQCTEALPRRGSDQAKIGNVNQRQVNGPARPACTAQIHAAVVVSALAAVHPPTDYLWIEKTSSVRYNGAARHVNSMVYSTKPFTMRKHFTRIHMMMYLNESRFIMTQRPRKECSNKFAVGTPAMQIM